MNKQMGGESIFSFCSFLFNEWPLNVEVGNERVGRLTFTFSVKQLDRIGSLISQAVILSGEGCDLPPENGSRLYVRIRNNYPKDTPSVGQFRATSQ